MKNKTVLITGASSGIGYELAKIFGKQGYQLVLTARDSERLAKIKMKLEKESKQKVFVIIEDLSETGSAKRVFEQVKALGLRIDILINNAGSGYVGLFHEKDFIDDFKMMQLNMGALTELTKLFAVEMIKAKEGSILNVASTGSYHPGPYTAVYYATKAYVLSLTEALAIELKPYGITVSALCPGATKTAFSKKAGKQDAKGAMEAKVVAEIAFKGLMRGEKIIIPGFKNKIFIKLPRNLVSPLIGKYQRTLANKDK